jgi:hypothetical protein
MEPMTPRLLQRVLSYRTYSFDPGSLRLSGGFSNPHSSARRPNH